jgi:hypothetical protein
MTIYVQVATTIKDFNGDDTNELSFQEPTVSDWLKWEEAGSEKITEYDEFGHVKREISKPSEIKQTLVLLKSCSTYGRELEKLSFQDVMKCGAELYSFLDLSGKQKKKG